LLYISGIFVGLKLQERKYEKLWYFVNFQMK